MSKCLPFNCKICSHYRYEEIRDSDYGAIYADEPTCYKENDINTKTDEYIED